MIKNQISSEEKELALRRALACPGIAESLPLRNFLEFTGEKVIRGEGAALDEHTIATEVLGKPLEFDPRLDPVVRVHARRLRKKLAEHYRGEGASDPVVVTTPKGSYRPDFIRRPWRWHVPLAPSLVAVLTVAGALLAAVLYYTWPLYRERVAVRQAEIAGMNALLEPFAGGAHRTIVAVRDRLFLEDDSGNLFRMKSESSLEQLSRGRWKPEALLASRPPGWSGNLYPAAQAGAGEAVCAALLARHFAQRGVPVKVRAWSGISEREFQESNVILLGIPDEKTLPGNRGAALDFHFADRPASSARWFPPVENRRPGTGEAPVYQGRLNRAQRAVEEAYSLMSYMPGYAVGSHWLILAGQSSAATQGACEYLLDGRAQRDLPATWMSPGQLPIRYQVLVRVAIRDLEPAAADYVTHHAQER